MIQSLFNRSNTSRIVASDHILDFRWQFQFFFLNNLGIFDNIYRDIMIDNTKDIQINDIDRSFNLDDVLFTHLVTFGILDDGYAAVKLIKFQIFVDIHAFSCFDVIQYEAL